MSKNVFESGKGEKVMVLEIVGEWCESLHVCARSCKKEEGKRLGFQVQRGLR